MLALLAATCNASRSAVGDGILLQESFSNPRSGWMSLEDSDGYLGYLNDAYVIRINSPRIVLWGLSNAGQVFSDIRLEVTARDESELFEVSFGVICHYADAGDFYLFEMGPDGFYRIVSLVGGEQTVLAGEEISPDISVGQTSYRLQVECAHGQQIMWVDDREIARTSDVAHASGDVGLVAHSYDRGGVEVHFDDLLVTEAPSE